MKSSHKLALLGTLAVGMVALPVAAQPAKAGGEKPAAAAGKPVKEAPHGELDALKQAKETRKAERAEAMGRSGDEAPGMEKAAQAKGATAEGIMEKGSKAHFHGALRQLRDEIKEGKVKKDEVKTRLMDLAKDRDARRQAHREAIRARWGQKLSNKDALQEVRQHERRMALLNRIALLAETEKSGQAQAKVLERVDKLIELENARHDKAMAKLQPSTAATAEPSEETAKGAAAAGQEEENDEATEEEAEENPSGGTE
jgi:hypothetical protein